MSARSDAQKFRDPRRRQSSAQPIFRSESSDKYSERWPNKPHEEPTLHDLVVEQKWDKKLGFAGNKRSFASKIRDTHAKMVMKCPTISDVMWSGGYRYYRGLKVDDERHQPPVLYTTRTSYATYTVSYE